MKCGEVTSLRVAKLIENICTKLCSAYSVIFLFNNAAMGLQTELSNFKENPPQLTATIGRIKTEVNFEFVETSHVTLIRMQAL